MSEDKKLYWQGKHPLGGGKNQIVMGDPLPEWMYIDTGEKDWKPDPRLDGWKDDGTVSEEAVVNFSKQKQNELELAGEDIRTLRGEVETLKDEISVAAKIAKNSKGNAAQKKKIAELEKEHKNAMAAEKVESGDIIAGLQLEVEALKNKSKDSGPK